MRIVTRVVTSSLFVAFCAVAACDKGSDNPAPATPAAPTAPATPASPATTSAVAPTRTFKFKYEVKIAKPADGSKHLDAWIPLPLEDDLQKVADLKTSAVSGLGGDLKGEITKDEQYGNAMLHAGVDDPKSDLVLSWTATITRTEDRGQGKGPMNDRFTQPDNLVPLTGKATEIAKKLGVDAAGDVRERSKKIYDNVLSTMVYDKKTAGFGRGDFDRACAVGKGNCTDFHAKFTGIGRAAGIPVRFTMGIPLKTDPKGTAGGYHCWAHFFDGTTWIPVDISEAQKINEKDPAKAQWFFGHLDPDRVALTVGRDLNLVPKQQGAPLLFFAYPYVEVDGKTTDVPAESRTFSWDAP
jgi:transglutaminase-like putative cysteine protease